MRCLPLRLLAVCLLLLLGTAVPCQATPSGVASIRWGTCSAPGGYDRYDSSSTSDVAWVTIQGISGTVREISFTLRLWAGGSQVPDAWRYDSKGCAGGTLVIAAPSPTGPCPVITGANRLEVTSIEYLAWASAAWSNGQETLRYAAGFDPIATNSSTTYTIAQVDFGHFNTALKNCGCLERPLCIELRDVTYRDGNGAEYTAYTWGSGIHWNDPGNALLCPGGPDLCIPECVWEADTLCVASTPVAQRSWGNLKASYR